MIILEKINEFLNERERNSTNYTPPEYAGLLKQKYGDIKKAISHARNRLRTAKDQRESSFYNDVIVMLQKNDTNINIRNMKETRNKNVKDTKHLSKALGVAKSTDKEKFFEGILDKFKNKDDEVSKIITRKIKKLHKEYTNAKNAENHEDVTKVIEATKALLKKHTNKEKW